MIVLIVAVGAAVLLAQPRQAAPAFSADAQTLETEAASSQIALKLGSEPFPMTVGPNTLRVSLTDGTGEPVDGAAIHVTRQMMNHGGAFLNAGTLEQTASGEYTSRIVWPNAAPWRVEITAELPDGATIKELFEIYIYAIPPQTISGEPAYHGLTATNVAVAAAPDRELWIVIPQGTQDMIKHGMAADVVPEEIRLAASGRNTLIIRNNDIADHTIGPYFVRAGETVRQRFTQPATFVGTCSIRQQAEVSIIVEG